MSLNRKELTGKLGPISSEYLKKKGHISYVDIFIKLGYLSEADYKNWREKKVPYLERVVKVNLTRISLIMKDVAKNCKNGKLKPSNTIYNSYGKGKKVKLRFSKSGSPHIEKEYSTHYLKKQTQNFKNTTEKSPHNNRVEKTRNSPSVESVEI